MWRSQTLCSWWEAGQEEGCEEDSQSPPQLLLPQLCTSLATPAKKQSETSSSKPECTRVAGES